MDGHVTVVAAELSSQGRQVDVFNEADQAGKTFDRWYIPQLAKFIRWC